MLKKHIDELHRISLILIERETIDKEQFERLLAGESEEQVFPDQALDVDSGTGRRQEEKPEPKARPFPIPGATMQPPPSLKPRKVGGFAASTFVVSSVGEPTPAKPASAATELMRVARCIESRVEALASRRGLVARYRAAQAKWTGDLRMCGANSCRMVERTLSTTPRPLLATLSTWPSDAGRRRLVRSTGSRSSRETSAAVQTSAQSEPIFLVPKQHLARNSDGRGGVFWVPSRGSPSRSRRRRALYGRFRAAGDRRGRERVVADPHSYLRLLRLPSPRARIADPAGEGREPTTGAIVSYWERVRRVFMPMDSIHHRETPWSDSTRRFGSAAVST